MRISLFLIFCGILFSCENQNTKIDIQVIPAPKEVNIQSGFFSVNAETGVYTNIQGEEKKYICDYLQLSPLNLKCFLAENTDKNVISLILNSTDTISKVGSYKLQIQCSNVKIEANTSVGLFYGLQTLLQLVNQYGKDKLPLMTIEDEPRFQYRGVLLDVSRHFFDKEFIKKQIDMMAYYKFNYLHWHLVDGPGWRVEIKQYPQLTEQVAWRPYEDCTEWGEKGRKYCTSAIPNAYGGYYTQEDIREVVAYAQKRFITIIPEIEMPGHCEEVLSAFPQYACLTDRKLHQDVCIGNFDVFTFFENVLLEIMELFPSQYIHIGGDEADKSDWKECNRCQHLMKKNGFNRVEQLQGYMVRYFDDFLAKHGRKLIGWDEILDGDVSPQAIVMSWRGEENGINAACLGHDVIMTPTSYCYFNFYQDNPMIHPLSWAGYVPIEKVYSYNPIPMGLSIENQKHILGVQANLWTEYIKTEQDAERMLWPRLLAISEVAWSFPEKKDYSEFHKRALCGVEFLQKKGYCSFDLKNEYGERKESFDTIRHKAYDKKVEYKCIYSKEYSAAGDKTLTDGLLGGWSVEGQRWQGFLGTDMDVVIQLDKVEDIHSINATFIQDAFGWFWLPSEVCIYISTDGENYMKLAEIGNTIPFDQKGFIMKDFGWSGNAQAKCIRYIAKVNIKKGFIFADEIIVK